MDRRKELKLAYKQNPPAKGVYQIQNITNGKLFIAGSMNLTGSENSSMFQLKMNCHRNSGLQQDWNRSGAESFAFSILETVKLDELPEQTWREAVSDLEDKWLNKLQPYGEKGYNKVKIAK